MFITEKDFLKLLFRKDKRSQILLVGAQRSGKSSLSQKVADQYIKTGRNALVYNFGDPEDFSSFTVLDLPNLEDQADLLNLDKKTKKKFLDKRRFALMGIRGNYFGIEKFNRLKGGFRAYRISDFLSEEMFFKDYFNYISNTLLVLDDPLSMYGYGMKAYIKNLHFRMNHSGKYHENDSYKMVGGIKKYHYKGAGSDIMNQFHSVDQVPSDLWPYCTHLINFRYEFMPQMKEVKNPYLQIEIPKIYNFLQNAPDYSFTLTDVKNKKSIFLSFDIKKNRYKVS